MPNNLYKINQAQIGLNTVQTIIRVQQPLGESLSNAVGGPRIPLPIGLYVNASIEGKTVENLGIIGKEQAIACEVICSLSR